MMNNIIESAKFVSENSKSVKINLSELENFANSLVISKSEHWTHFLPLDFNKFGEIDKINFLFICDSIGFCFWGNPKWT